MDIKEFTTQTLVQIVKGANEADSQLQKIGGYIPKNGLASNGDYRYVRGTVEGNVIDVDFDVAITATESDGKSGGAGIKVVAFNFGGNVESKVESQTISRIKYTIPLVLSIKKK